LGHLQALQKILNILSICLIIPHGPRQPCQATVLLSGPAVSSLQQTVPKRLFAAATAGMAMQDLPIWDKAVKN
jgi:hypothetical protein